MQSNHTTRTLKTQKHNSRNKLHQHVISSNLFFAYAKFEEMQPQFLLVLEKLPLAFYSGNLFEEM